MHSSNLNRTFFGITALATLLAGAQGCVADRPSRNGVFDENQYVRKDFLVQTGPDGVDDGWYMKATITQTSTPNPLANLGLFNGAENTGSIARFVITSDKLQLVDMRELSQSSAINAQDTRTPSVINAWPITNVDLKYQINLDGEKTNFYQENQELDWQVRQWVKLTFDKNDLSDIAGLGTYPELMLNKCADGPNSSATLVPNSFMVDTPNKYMQWTVNVTAPLNMTDADCVQAFGSAGNDFVRMGRSTVSFNVMYSLVKATPVDPTSYTPLVIPEKDPILHKYGPIEITNYSRDPDTGLLAARQLAMRFNPGQSFTWYLAQGYPQDQEATWTDPTSGIAAQTNAIFKQTGAKIQMKVLRYNDLNTFGDGAGPARVYGDVRYNFIRWESDLDTDSPFLAVTQFQPDLRTGQIVSASVNVAAAPLQDFVGQRTLAYIQKIIGINPFSDPPPDPTDPTKTISSTCTVGMSLPLLPATVQAHYYANSTLYQRMAQYLPPAPDGASTPGPTDYVYQHTGVDGAAFYNAYLAYIPYTTYADPLTNQFVTPADLSQPAGAATLLSTWSAETQFEQAVANMDQGQGLSALQVTDGESGMQDAYNAVDSFRQSLAARRNYNATWQLQRTTMRADTADIASFPQVVARSSRKCINTNGNVHWETFDEWQNALLQSYKDLTVWHEFGHVLGLEHNFMGSVDKANWPTYTTTNLDGSTSTVWGKQTSSVMEYSVTYDDTFWNTGAAAGQTPQEGWLPYDRAAIAWIYANNLSPSAVGPQPVPANSTVTAGISGQVSATVPWNDPIGFSGTTETQFLYCNEAHLHYTPLCRQFDVGATPSEITAADIEQYEWNYQWRNFRNYLKVWDDSSYGSQVADIIDNQRRFLALQAWDWSATELTDKLLRINLPVPPDAVNAGAYYTMITNHFNSDIGAAENLTAAFHEAIIQQSTGQRPFQTSYDPYFGDVTQQGIALDKATAFTYWLGLWPFDNYDPTQAAGYYFSSMVEGPGQTGPDQAWSTAGSMLGEKGAWDAYPGYFPSAVALFAHDTQDPTFTGLGYPQMRDWIGGHTFSRLEDVLAYFQNIAVQNPTNPISVAANCTSQASLLSTAANACNYNPMTPQINSNDIGHTNPATNDFFGPDNRHYVWMYIADRNEYVFVDKDRNPSAYIQVYTYNQDVNTNYDDGNGGPVYSYQAKIKYMLDAYNLFGGDTQTN